MLDAGIIDPNALSHEVHLWPKNKVNPQATLARFKRGVTFYGNNDCKISIYDIPKGTRVVLHANLNCKIKVTVE